MEYVDGTDLAKTLENRGKVLLPVTEACDYVRQAALGLQHAHQKGMVHRDVKPGNLLLCHKDGVVKLLDMGLARLQEAKALTTAEGSVMGTPDYIAPEQALDSHTVDIRADIYSLGCTLYHLLTAKVPFAGTQGQKIAAHMHKEPAPVESHRADLPRYLLVLVRKMMAKKPADRCQTPAEAALALEHCIKLAGGFVPREVETRPLKPRPVEEVKIDTVPPRPRLQRRRQGILLLRPRSKTPALGREQGYPATTPHP